MDTPSTISAAADMARQLMSDGPHFKRGYSLDNAALAVASVSPFTPAAIAAEVALDAAQSRGELAAHRAAVDTMREPNGGRSS